VRSDNARGGSPIDVSASDYAALVRENRPEWLMEIIRSLAPDSATTDDIRNELQNLLNDLRVKRISPHQVVDYGNITVSAGLDAVREKAQVANNLAKVRAICRYSRPAQSALRCSKI
jgi:hypothetical protein